MTEQQKFRGFHSPNYTQVPDELFDELLPMLSGAELKVLLYITRRTFGFKKPSDNISLSQITDGIVTSTGKRIDGGTGLVKSTAALAVKGLVEKNIILKVRNQAPRRGDMATTYALNLITTPVQQSTPSVSENHTPPRQEIRHPVGRKSDTQETVRQETAFKNVNVASKTRSGPSGWKRSSSAISEQALMNRYGFEEQQIDETHGLVALQVDVLGAGDRNHASYVKRAAEAVRDHTANILRLTLGELKDTNHHKTIVSLPAYFTRIYDAARAEALRGRAEPVPTSEPLPPTPLTDEDLRRAQREQLIESIAAKGYRIPDQIRWSSVGDIAAWYDQIERTQPGHP